MTEIGTLHDFAVTAEAVAATTKKLEKAAILGDYLKSLTDVDLSRAARYFAGHQFAQSIRVLLMLAAASSVRL